MENVCREITGCNVCNICSDKLVMSELIRLKVHYGVGTVCEGPYGVDLSDFRQVTLVHPDLENARIGDVLHWLTRSFSLDPEVWSLIV